MDKDIKGKLNKRLFSATLIVIVALVIVIAANGVVWKNRFARSAEIERLNSEISQVSRDIARVAAPPADLDARLAQATANLTTAQTALPPKFNRNDAIDYIIGLARDCQVEAMPISSQGWLVEDIGQHYPVLKLNTSITGTFTQANEFISKLQHGKYPALVVPEIGITRNSSANITGTFSGDNTNVTVRLSISIYARPAAAKGSN